MRNGSVEIDSPIQEIISFMRIPAAAMELQTKQLLAVNDLLLDLIGYNQICNTETDALALILKNCIDLSTLENIIDIILSEGINSYTINSLIQNSSNLPEMMKIVFSLQRLSKKDILIISFKKTDNDTEMVELLEPIGLPITKPINTTLNIIEENHYDISNIYKGVANNTKPISILIADDNIVTAKLIEKNISQVTKLKVAGIVKNGQEVIDFISYKNVDIIILDVNMPIMNGIETLNRLKEENKFIKIVMLSGDCSIEDLRESFSLGANGFISKQSNNFDIINSIFTVYFGGFFLCSICIKNVLTTHANKLNFENSLNQKQITSSFGRQQSLIGKSTASDIDFSLLEEKAKISKREKDIIRLVALGKTNSEIADNLCISIRTVETHRRNILQKFGEKNFFNLFLCNNK